MCNLYAKFVKIYYFGYKLHPLCGLNGIIHSYDLSKASVHDINYLKNVKQGFYNIKIFGDKAYISEDVQLDLFEKAHIQLEWSVQGEPEELEADIHPICQGKEED